MKNLTQIFFGTKESTDFLAKNYDDGGHRKIARVIFACGVIPFLVLFLSYVSVFMPLAAEGGAAASILFIMPLVVFWGLLLYLAVRGYKAGYVLYFLYNILLAVTSFNSAIGMAVRAPTFQVVPFFVSVIVCIFAVLSGLALITGFRVELKRKQK